MKKTKVIMVLLLLLLLPVGVVMINCNDYYTFMKLIN